MSSCSNFQVYNFINMNLINITINFADYYYGTPSKKMGFFGNFPKCQTPPPFGNPSFQKQKGVIF